MPPKRADKSVSDRAEEVKRRMLHATMRHASDVRGAMGCYYCWIGDYQRCEQHCKLVHRTAADAADGASGGSSTGGGRAPRSAFDAATPFLTAMHAQEKSLFNEIVGPADSQIRSVQQQMQRDLARTDALLAGASGGGGGGGGAPRRSTTAAALQRSMALYNHRPSAALRHPELRSHRRPLEATTAFQSRHGAYNIQATPYTTIAVTPAWSSFTARHRDYLADDTAIWGGTLAKASTTGHDRRSRALGERMAAMASANIPAASRKLLDGQAQTFLRAHAEPVLSGIARGHYRDALALPVPTLFDEVL